MFVNIVQLFHVNCAKMKRSIIFFALSFMAFISVVLLAAAIPSVSPDTQIVNIESSALQADSGHSLGWYLSEYWEFIALAASEIFAFLPTKYNGLTHALIKIGASLFGKKSVT